MKLTRKIIFLPVICFAVGAMSACGGGDDSKTIKIWWPSGAKYKTIITNAQSTFEKAHPEYKVKITYKAGLDLYQTYQIALNDPKSRPDIAILDHVYVSSLAHEGQVANLTSLGADNTIRTLFPDTVYQANRYLGNTYGLPLSANTVALMYNKDILEDNGIEDAPKTFTELKNDLQTIQDAGKANQIPFAQPINSTFCAMEFASYVARLGGKIVSDDYRTCLIDSNEVKDAVNKWVELSKFASQAEYEESKFYEGFCGFIEMGSWNLYKVTGTTALFDLGVSEMVTIDPQISNYSGLGLYSLVVTEKSANKELAYEFAKYLSTDKQTQLDFADVDDLFPCTTEALADKKYTEDPILSVFASQLTKVAARPGSPAWPAMEKSIVNMLYRAVKATTSSEIDNAITICQSECQAATDRKFNK